MEISTFTIVFPEHNPQKMQYVLERLTDDADSLETVDALTYRVVCRKPNQLRRVGWALFHTHYANVCTVVEVSGDAKLKASAYPFPGA